MLTDTQLKTMYQTDIYTGPCLVKVYCNYWASMAIAIGNILPWNLPSSGKGPFPKYKAELHTSRVSMIQGIGSISHTHDLLLSADMIAYHTCKAVARSANVDDETPSTSTWTSKPFSVFQRKHIIIMVLQQ